MSEKIEPALTPEEWKRLQTFLPLTATIENATTMDLCVMADRSRPALAALALYGQTFGFTRNDVRLLDDQIDELDREWAGKSLANQLRSLRDRIESLLPPEK